MDEPPSKCADTTRPTWKAKISGSIDAGEAITALTFVIADITGTHVRDLDTLHDCIATEAVNEVLEGSSGVCVRFTYKKYDVAVRAGGEVEVVENLTVAGP